MRQITDQLLASLPDHDEEMKILDAGCGAGGNLTALSRFGCAVGLDYSPLALVYASANHAGKLVRASIEALPYADNSFDLVTSFDVMVCHEVEDDLNAMREFARVTRPGGHVLVRVAALPALRGPHDTVVHAARRYTASELRLKMQQAGLEPVRMTYANSILMPLIFVIRKLQTLGVSLGSAAKSDVSQTPKTINNLLISLLNLEAHWLGSGHGFPIGVSLFGLALKPVSQGVVRNDQREETQHQRVLSSL
jgi:hypothetical protein